MLAQVLTYVLLPSAAAGGAALGVLTGGFLALLLLEMTL